MVVRRVFPLLAVVLLAWPILVRAEPAPSTTPERDNAMHLAFVLLPTNAPPTGEAIVKAFPSFAALGQKIRLHPPREGAQAKPDILEFDLGPGETALVAMMPVPVPSLEAEGHVEFSVSALGTGWKLPPHQAHLIVTLGKPKSQDISTLSAFTSVLAAVAEASKAVGVYWGAAGATHDARYFVATARERDTGARITLWTGLSVAREPDGRVSLLSLGMKQLDLPNLLLVAPKSSMDEAVGLFFPLLAMLAEEGEALPEGDTVGRTAEEKLPVHYVPSPLDASEKVWRVELPGK